MRLADWVFGSYLSNSEETEQRIGVGTGVSLLGLDALSSSAYGPEAALTVLLPIGAIGITYALPIVIAIIALLFIVYFSYRQTIAAYPNGGGSYTVARENLGDRAGVLAAAALLLDYVLTVAVGISAGVGALISALPFLQPYTLALCLGILLLIALINLRGIKESGLAFILPTYAFIVTIFAAIAWGLFKTAMSGGHPVPVETLPVMSPSHAGLISFWLIARAFASGCTAMTGVEAVSNGVKVFKDPVVRNAQRTLTAIILILAVMLAGIAYLSFAYGIGATPPGDAGYESMISQLLRAVAGKGVFYYVTIFSVTAVLCFSANTGFADFPRLCQILAKDNFLPHAYAERGRRLVFTSGVLLLATLSGALLAIFGGVTDRLIPLYAIGAFMAFTLSQAGMVKHWLKLGARENWHSIAVNLTGAIATGLTLVVVLVSKFTEGGWITVLLIPSTMIFFMALKKHYAKIELELTCEEPIKFDRLKPLVIVPVRQWNKAVRKSLLFASQISDDVYVTHVENSDENSDVIEQRWQTLVEQPARDAGVKPPKYVKLESPYRRLFSSLFEFIDQLEKEFPNRRITIVIPQLAERKWYNYFLHNQRAVLLSAAVYLRADQRIVCVNVPWYLDV